MDEEKKYLGKWWAWVLGLLIITAIILTGLNWFGLIGSTIVERKVFENSFQYSEARKIEIATFKAQLAEIDGQLLNQNLEAGTMANLKAQKSAIKIKLKVAKEKAK